MADDCDDLVLSDVHVGTNSKASIGESTCTSKFLYTIEPERQTVDAVYMDEDGDLVVPRSKATTSPKVILIDHTMATPLDSVGTQLWNAALFLGDYIIHSRQIFQDAVALELGGGCGFIGIVVSNWVRHCFCTDIGENVLEICQRNIIQNGVANNVSVHELDWLNPNIDDFIDNKFAWKEHDVRLLKKTSIILAADVIYQDHLTDAFFNTLVHLSTVVLETPPLILVSMEKRINFSMDTFAPSSPAYDYFRFCLARTYKNANNETVNFHFQQLPTKFPQSFFPTSVSHLFLYERVKELELWQLEIVIQKD